MNGSSLTRVLIKLYALKFYKANAGLFLFFFVTLILYLFFINVLNETHLLPEQVIMEHLIVVLTVISSPAIMFIVFLIWIIYTIKSCKFLIAQMRREENSFLYYSSTSFSKINQYRSWFVAQFVIAVPMVIYGLFAIVIGIIYNYHFLPIVMQLFIVLLIACPAGFAVWHLNKFVNHKYHSVVQYLAKWPKPLFSLFFYHILNECKIAFMIIKVISYAIIAGSIHLFSNVNGNVLPSVMVILGVVTAHSMILYQSYYFENRLLRFVLNFSDHPFMLYLKHIVIWLVLCLPEMIWVVIYYAPFHAFTLVLFGIGAAMVFRSVLYVKGLDVRHFLVIIFYLFVLYFICILFRILWPLIGFNFLLSVVIYGKYYYKQKHSENYL